MDHKPTLEELKEIQTQSNNEIESQRVDLAINLNICPECGSELHQGILGVLFSYKKCSKCKTKFTIMTDFTEPY